MLAFQEQNLIQAGFGGIKADSYTKYLLGTIGVSQLVYDFGVTQNQYTIDKLVWESAKQI